MPAWYYLKPLLLNSIPLSLLVPVAVATAFAIPIPHRDESHDLQGYRRALCVRFFATFWVVTVVFFELSAFKRRAYLLPLWPTSAVLLSWWVLDCVVPRVGTAAYQWMMAICLLLAIGNLFVLPPYDMRGCESPYHLSRCSNGRLRAWLVGRTPKDFRRSPFAKLPRG